MAGNLGVWLAEMDISPTIGQNEEFYMLSGGGFVSVWTEGIGQTLANVFDAEGKFVRQDVLVTYEQFGLANAYALPVNAATGANLTNGDLVIGANTGGEVAGRPTSLNWVWSYDPFGNIKYAQRQIDTDAPGEKTNYAFTALSDGTFVSAYLLESVYNPSTTNSDFYNATILKKLDADLTPQNLFGGWANVDQLFGGQAALRTADSVADYGLQGYNTIYSSSVALANGGFATVYSRPESGGQVSLYYRIFDAAGNSSQIVNDIGAKVAFAVAVSPTGTPYSAGQVILIRPAQADTIKTLLLSDGSFVVEWMDSTLYGSTNYATHTFAILSSEGFHVADQVAVEIPFASGQPVEWSQMPASLVAFHGGFAIATSETYFDGSSVTIGRLAVRLYDNLGVEQSEHIFTFGANNVICGAPDLVLLDDGTFLVGLEHFRVSDSANGFRVLHLDADGNQIGDALDLFAGHTFDGLGTADLMLLADGRVSVRATDSATEENFIVILDPRDSVIRGDARDEVITSRKDGARVLGLEGNDTLLGQGSKDILKGGDGKDVLLGRNGKDSLFGEAGKDDLSGGKGDDKLSGGDQDDKIKGESGDDRLYGDRGKDRCPGEQHGLACGRQGR
ncbi:MAG: hypothetical protein H6874_08935 [Hyphomicrobiaceae bacterium]|nr:hypothetical protein [Hyphomicrobiaceae bacterium]